MLPVIALLLGTAFFEPPAGGDPVRLQREADRLYTAGQYKESAAAYARAVEAGANDPAAPYNAACCHARLGSRDDAFRWLTQALDRGWSDLDHLSADADLAGLRADPRWKEVIARCTAARDRKRNSVSHPALREELLTRMREDQAVRTAPRPDLSKMRRVDAANTAWMKKVLDEHGWPGRSMVGEDGAMAAWLLVQHADADPQFQARGLELMKKAWEKQQVRAQDLAYLTDRVLVHQGKKQLYGTQFFTFLGKSMPRPIEDEGKVDARRAAMGLGPLDEYRKIMEAQAKGP
jgi:tetratricopeptide (TPR) repeat protein